MPFDFKKTPVSHIANEIRDGIATEELTPAPQTPPSSDNTQPDNPEPLHTQAPQKKVWSGEPVGSVVPLPKELHKYIRDSIYDRKGYSVKSWLLEAAIEKAEREINGVG